MLIMTVMGERCKRLVDEIEFLSSNGIFIIQFSSCFALVHFIFEIKTDTVKTQFLFAIKTEIARSNIGGLSCQSERYINFCSW